MRLVQRIGPPPASEASVREDRWQRLCRVRRRMLKMPPEALRSDVLVDGPLDRWLRFRAPGLSRSHFD